MITRSSDSAVLTEDGVVGSSGEATTVYSIILTSAAAAVTAVVYDGTSTGGTKKLSLKHAETTDSVPFEFPFGLHFPSGCYVDVGGTGVEVNVVYNQNA